MRVVALAAATLVLAGPASAAGAGRACRLATVAQASVALRSPVDRRTERDSHPHGLRLASCLYNEGGLIVATVAAWRLTYASFLQTASVEPKPVIPLRGLGATAFSFGPDPVLLTWRHGTALIVSAPGLDDRLAAEKRLAKTELAHL